MENKLYLILIIGVFLMGTVFAGNWIQIDSCGELNVSNSYYQLSQDINVSVEECFVITADDVTIDFAHHSLYRDNPAVEYIGIVARDVYNSNILNVVMDSPKVGIKLVNVERSLLMPGNISNYSEIGLYGKEVESVKIYYSEFSGAPLSLTGIYFENAQNSIIKKSTFYGSRGFILINSTNESFVGNSFLVSAKEIIRQWNYGGVVKDLNGSFIENASILIKDVFGTSVESFVTDSLGEFGFGKLIEYTFNGIFNFYSNYTIEVSYLNYTFTKEYNLSLEKENLFDEIVLDLSSGNDTTNESNGTVIVPPVIVNPSTSGGNSGSSRTTYYLEGTDRFEKLKVRDYVKFEVNGTSYTLEIKRITSDSVEFQVIGKIFKLELEDFRVDIDLDGEYDLYMDVLGLGSRADILFSLEKNYTEIPEVDLDLNESISFGNLSLNETEGSNRYRSFMTGMATEIGNLRDDLELHWKNIIWVLLILLILWIVYKNFKEENKKVLPKEEVKKMDLKVKKKNSSVKVKK